MFLVIPTHTPRHLATCLASLAWQTDPPDAVVVSCDVQDAAIDRVVDDTWPRIAGTLHSRRRTPPALWLVSRPHTGEARLNQVRNNAIRTILDRCAPDSRDTIVVLDGDTLLAPDAILRHRGLARQGCDVVVSYRINLDEGRTRLLDTDEILRFACTGDMPAALAQAAHHAAPALANRQERYEVQQLRRRRFAWLPFTRIVKPHKPKILGGHHAVSVRALRAVNGFDEMYTGYGYDDDDLTRRLYEVDSLHASIAVADILAFHLWHPSRAPESPTMTPGYQRFKRKDLPTRAEFGLDSPRPQGEIQVRSIHLPIVDPAIEPKAPCCAAEALG